VTRSWRRSTTRWPRGQRDSALPLIELHQRRAPTSRRLGLRGVALAPQGARYVVQEARPRLPPSLRQLQQLDERSGATGLRAQRLVSSSILLQSQDSRGGFPPSSSRRNRISPECSHAQHRYDAIAWIPHPTSCGSFHRRAKASITHCECPLCYCSTIAPRRQALLDRSLAGESDRASRPESPLRHRKHHAAQLELRSVPAFPCSSLVRLVHGRFALLISPDRSLQNYRRPPCDRRQRWFCRSRANYLLLPVPS